MKLHPKYNTKKTVQHQILRGQTQQFSGFDDVVQRCAQELQFQYWYDDTGSQSSWKCVWYDSLKKLSKWQ